MKLAEKYSKLIRNSQGRSLKTIGLDVYTISEMLRLYFLTSGSLNNQKIKFWYQQRGGYTNLDDIGIDFALYESDIVKKLENVNVFELEPGMCLFFFVAFQRLFYFILLFRGKIENIVEFMPSADHTSSI